MAPPGLLQEQRCTSHINQTELEFNPTSECLVQKKGQDYVAEWKIARFTMISPIKSTPLFKTSPPAIHVVVQQGSENRPAVLVVGPCMSQECSC